MLWQLLFSPPESDRYHPFRGIEPQPQDPHSWCPGREERSKRKTQEVAVSPGSWWGKLSQGKWCSRYEKLALHSTDTAVPELTGEPLGILGHTLQSPRSALTPGTTHISQRWRPASQQFKCV